jgi:hypothetical protein
MLGPIVDYLWRAHVPFRLASYPSEESEPLAAHHLPAGGVLVDTKLLTANGRTVLAVYPRDESVGSAAVGAALGTIAVLDGTNDDLPGEFRHAEAPLPPLGQLFGIPVILDQRVADASVLVFRAFAGSDYFEIPYQDYARLEQPRLASITYAGALGMGAERGRRTKQVKSDLKDARRTRSVEPEFPHDRDQTPPSRKDRRPLQTSSRSDHVPHAVRRGDNEKRGGRDRKERPGRRRVQS